MKPGRKLDKLMAEVMGWEKTSQLLYPGGDAPAIIFKTGDGSERIVGGPYWEEALFKPSSDLVAAMELIPIVLRDWDSAKEHDYESEFGAWYKLDWEKYSNPGPGWWAAFGVEDSYEGKAWRYEAYAPELAHAICLAVCEVKGIKINEPV